MNRAELRRSLARRTVGIAGAGGLGSNCAVALARAGVGTLVVVDFDIVSPDNLDRQYYFADQAGMPKVLALAGVIRRIDPSIVVRAHELRLEPAAVPGIFAACDVVVEAFDDANEKLALIEAVSNGLPGIPVVAASGIAGWGGFGPRGYRSLPVSGGGSLYLVGDQDSEAGPGNPPIAPRVGAAACIQADIVLSLLLDAGTRGGMLADLAGGKT